MKSIVNLKSYFVGGDYNAYNNSKVITVNGVSFYFYFETLICVKREKEAFILKNTYGEGAKPYYDCLPEGTILNEDDFAEKVKEIVEK